MSLRSYLIKLARAVVQQVQAGLTQQLNIVLDQVRSPVKAIIQKVVGGAWRGAGADAFVEELSGLIIPELGVISGHIETTQQRIQKAVEIMDQADDQVNNQINNLADIFDAIY